jgi:natural product precursor
MDTKKLTLSKETLRSLDDRELTEVVGGGGGDVSIVCISFGCQSVAVCDSGVCKSVACDVL